MSVRGGPGGDDGAFQRERNLAALDQLVAPGRRGTPGDAFLEAARSLARAVLGRLAWDGRPDLDDLAQECLEAAWRSAGNLRDAGAWRAWVTQIAVRVYRRWRTGQFRRQRKVEAARRESEHLFQQGPIRPDRAAESRELLRKSLEALSPGKRAVAILAGQKYTAGEIADLLGKTEGTVWRLLSEARAQLRAELAEAPAGESLHTVFADSSVRGSGEEPPGETEE